MFKNSLFFKKKYIYKKINILKKQKIKNNYTKKLFNKTFSFIALNILLNNLKNKKFFNLFRSDLQLNKIIIKLNKTYLLKFDSMYYVDKTKWRMFTPRKYNSDFNIRHSYKRFNLVNFLKIFIYHINITKKSFLNLNKNKIYLLKQINNSSFLNKKLKLNLLFFIILNLLFKKNYLKLFSKFKKVFKFKVLEFLKKKNVFDTKNKFRNHELFNSLNTKIYKDQRIPMPEQKVQVDIQNYLLNNQLNNYHIDEKLFFVSLLNVPNMNYYRNFFYKTDIRKQTRVKLFAQSINKKIQ